jgi:hypothetical protein
MNLTFQAGGMFRDFDREMIFAKSIAATALK